MDKHSPTTKNLPHSRATNKLHNPTLKKNVIHKTGGPFAAGVFEQNTGKLVSIGVNRVIPLNLSIAHAEIVAISNAQHKLKTYDLGASNQPIHELVVNWCPCAMCYGSIIWSGIRSLAIAGSGSELEQITGFDEGPLHPDWMSELEQRGISFQDNIMKKQAIDVFKYYMKTRGAVYNARLTENNQ